MKQIVSTAVVIFLLLIACSQAKEKPQFTRPLVDITSAEAGVVYFFCEASGDPSPVFTWFKRGNLIKANSSRRFTVTSTTSGSVLTIDPAKPKRDETRYSCKAQNEVGIAESHGTLKLYDRSQIPPGFPRLIQRPQTRAVEEGKPFLLNCEATGDPPPTVTWLRNVVLVDTSHPRFSILPRGTLQVKDSKKEDEGKYACIATNSVGTASSYPASLYIRTRKKAMTPLITLPSVLEVPPGGDVNLTCETEGASEPNFSWFLGNEKESREDASIVSRENVLKLVNVTESANYTCFASSAGGAAWSTVLITVSVTDAADRPAFNGVHIIGIFIVCLLQRSMF